MWEEIFVCFSDKLRCRFCCFHRWIRAVYPSAGDKYTTSTQSSLFYQQNSNSNYLFSIEAWTCSIFVYNLPPAENYAATLLSFWKKTTKKTTKRHFELKKRNKRKVVHFVMCVQADGSGGSASYKRKNLLCCRRCGQYLLLLWSFSVCPHYILSLQTHKLTLFL